MIGISVVLPTHNRADVLPRAIASVMQQTYPALELIVVDDGSTDATPEVMAKHADPRVIYIRLDRNRGGNFARNRGIERASGEAIAFLDSDDEFLPDKLERLARLFEQRPEIDVVLDSYVTRRHGLFGERSIRRPNPSVEDNSEFRAALFEQRFHKSASAIAARRAALVAAGMFDETIFRRQDTDVLLRLSRDHRCVAVPDTLWIKHHTSRAVSARRDNVLEAVIALCQRHPEYLTVPRYRRALLEDLRRHFRHVLRSGRVRQFVQDLARYRSWEAAPAPAWRLMLGGDAV